jgi:hypothetical protein
MSDLFYHNDIGYTIKADYKEYHIDFYVYRNMTYGLDADENDSVVWLKKNGTWQEETSNIEEAETYVHGFIKWDGCSNWEYNKDSDIMIHFCGSNEAEFAAKVIPLCYKIASEHYIEDL